MIIAALAFFIFHFWFVKWQIFRKKKMLKNILKWSLKISLNDHYFYANGSHARIKSVCEEKKEIHTQMSGKKMFVYLRKREY